MRIPYTLCLPVPNYSPRDFLNSIFLMLRLEIFFICIFSDFSIEGVRAKVYFKAVPTDEQNGLTFMRVEETKMDFSVKNIQMGVDNVAGGNPVIRE